MFQTYPLYTANLYATEDIVVNQGGTSSGKTYAILQALFSIAVNQKGKVITVTSQDVPNLKAGALRDALEIYSNTKALKSLVTNYNKSERIFEFASGSLMEFKSFENSQDAKSGKRDYLFINEANGITYDMFNELQLRTRERVFIDYNPNNSFWVHEQLIGKPGVRLFITDHRYNPFLTEPIRRKIESLKEKDEELWRVYARGMTGKIDGLIFRNWSRIGLDEMPADAKLIGYGLDFGFTNDPTALTELRQQNGELFIKLHIYETGLTNTALSQRMNELYIPHDEWIIADSAEPKSIAELHALGWKIEGANKGPDSVKNGIDILKRYKLNLVGESAPLIRELNAYKWRVDRITGNTLNEPVDAFNHALDSLRYVALNRLVNSGYGEYVIV